MNKKRVLLLCAEPLLSESLENLLGGLEDVRLIGPCELDKRALGRIAEHKPDVVLVADGRDPSYKVHLLLTRVLEKYPGLPVIHSTLSHNRVSIFTSQVLPARAAELIDAIRRLPVRKKGEEYAA